MTGITVTIDGELAKDLDATKRRLVAEREQLLERIGQAGVRLARGYAPVLTDEYRSKIGYTVRAASVDIGSSSRKAHLVEKGRQPGKPPPAKAFTKGLRGRIDNGLTASGRKRGVTRKQRASVNAQAFLIARAIGRRGTEGHDVFERTREALRPVVNAEAGALLRRAHRAA
jgi:hypothetical protein